ncbi:MAG: HDIG domain-containing protein [Deltaproteobacteria bacterium]|nr:HDIG domain-containing protein [Deltaproteobacteria bacterium]
MNKSHQQSLKSILGDFKKSDFSSWKNFRQSAFFGWFVFLLFLVMISLILSFRIDTLPSDIQLGRKVENDIRADEDYVVVDQEKTLQEKQKAANSVSPIFDYDPSIVKLIDQKIAKTFVMARTALAEFETPEKIRNTLNHSLGVMPSANLLNSLIKDGFSGETENAIRSLFDITMSQRIVSIGSDLPQTPEQEVIIRRLGQFDSELVEGEDEGPSVLKTRQEAVSQLETVAEQEFSGLNLSLSPAQIAEFVSPLVQPNTKYNHNDTQAKRQQAREDEAEIFYHFKRGDLIVRGGESLKEKDIKILQAIRKQKSDARYMVKFVGIIMFVAMMLLLVYTFSRRYIRKFSPSRQDLYFLGGTLFLILLGIRLTVPMIPGIQAGFADGLIPQISTDAFYYAIPVAGGAMLVRYILNSESAVIFALVMGLLIGLFLEANLDSVYFVISGIAGASVIAQVTSRTSILKAGLWLGLLNAFFIIAIELVTVVSVTADFSIGEMLLSSLMGVAGGLLSAVFVMVVAPIAELIFDYVTDIKLLELGNLNHPLLRDMIVKAPGTYHHSQLVAVLAEAAAAEIGANPLLARVGSYFHDIGKMRKPAYFIENQPKGENRHDKLTPSMSALIIASHVKDGIEMAREYKLPRRITDFIPEHQGTKVISFFYNKAKELRSENDPPIDEKHYSYPGPRPQTRESGIVLLADGVEAAVRSLPEKTLPKIQAKVQEIISKNFAEEQLDQCDLTLRDLHVISDTFTRTLVGIYHQRIQYPDMPEMRSNVTPIQKRLSKSVTKA